MKSLALAAAGCIAGLTSCTGKNGPVYEDPVFELDTSADNPVLLVSEETYALTYHAEGISTVTLEDVPEGWQASVDGEPAASMSQPLPPLPVLPIIT